MSSTKVQQWVASLALGLLAVTAGTAIVSAPAMAQEEPKTEELARKAKTRVAPVYPDIARRMSITGVVKLAVVVAPNGEPVTIRANVPVGVDREVAMVRTLVPVGVTGLVPKAHVTPVGGFTHDKVTGLEVPAFKVAVIVTVRELP